MALQLFFPLPLHPSNLFPLFPSLPRFHSFSSVDSPLMSFFPSFPLPPPVTIAAVPSTRRLFPVGGLPPSPWRSLAPWLRRTAGRRCAAPRPPSPTGRGNERPPRLGPACTHTGPSLTCTYSGVFDVVLFCYLVCIVSYGA